MIQIGIIMTRRPPGTITILAAVLALTVTGCSPEQSLLSHEQIVGADFEAILEVQGQPCGQVDSFRKNTDLDYQVTCSSGDVYRIHVSQEGLVNVTPHTP